MITKQFIAELATKTQTTQENIAREYCQNLFLSYFYKKPKSERVPFKGGTALRIIFKSPRFSEDLDFSATNGRTLTILEINHLIDVTLKDIQNEGMVCEKILNPGTQGETTGGYYALVTMASPEFNTEIKIQISFRSPQNVISNTALVDNEFTAAYVITHLKESLLVAEKVDALLQRHKARDFFDLYFILRNNDLVNFIPKIPNLKIRILEVMGQKKNLEIELKKFLPVSYHSLTKDFKVRLKKEVEIRIS